MIKDNQHYSLDQDHDIVIFKGKGVWKPEVSTACIRSINTLIQLQNLQDFALILDTSDIQSLTPQCFDAWEEAQEVWREHGLKMTVRIDKPEAGFYKIFLAGFDDILRLKTKFCSSSSESYALKSIHNAGFRGFESK